MKRAKDVCMMSLHGFLVYILWFSFVSGYTITVSNVICENLTWNFLYRRFSKLFLVNLILKVA